MPDTTSPPPATDPSPEAMAIAHEILPTTYAQRTTYNAELQIARALDAFRREGVEPYAAALREIALLPDVSADEAAGIAMRALNWSQLP